MPGGVSSSGGRSIENQGVAFKLADMRTEIDGRPAAGLARGLDVRRRECAVHPSPTSAGEGSMAS